MNLTLKIVSSGAVLVIVGATCLELDILVVGTALLILGFVIFIAGPILAEICQPPPPP